MNCGPGGVKGALGTPRDQTAKEISSADFQEHQVLKATAGRGAKMHEVRTMQTAIEAAKKSALSDICLISGKDLARAVGFADTSDAFRSWCHLSGIKPVPGRQSQYDPKLVRQRLDELQGLSEKAANDEPVSLVEQRRARLATR